MCSRTMCGRTVKMSHAAYRGVALSVLSFALLPSVYGQTGASFGQAMQARLFGKGPHKYCDKNCSPDDNKVISSANDFAAHHKEFMPSPVNVQAFATYIRTFSSAATAMECSFNATSARLHDTKPGS